LYDVQSIASFFLLTRQFAVRFNSGGELLSLGPSQQIFSGSVRPNSVSLFDLLLELSALVVEGVLSDSSSDEEQAADTEENKENSTE
jgi:hypothetical protein